MGDQRKTIKTNNFRWPVFIAS